MNASRVAVVSAIAAAVAWGLKAVAIGVAGGLDKSPFEAPLFVLGLAAIVAAFVALGVAVASGRPMAFKIIGGVIGVAIGLALSALASWVAAAVLPESAGWVQAEAGLWFAALLTLIVTTSWHTRQDRARSGG